MKINHSDRPLYRILDANLNRAKEGLRVCEDLCRYIWNQKTLTRAFKDLRHDLTGIIAGLDIQKALEARQIQRDVGRATIADEIRRKDIKAVFWANSQRVKESLRVLEEVVKLIDGKRSSGLKALRYKVYALEQKAIGSR
ncbi:MAG: thiamine-phosphate pyrophosphorylase [Candidatus Omnitrophica bacterium]|nr:thiamine-phosphate pyrophosphorylase [Candidatus Omnitrophota bacterium]MDE2010219.1 thiamine-phosphate pyrophosphorylase [Candidatus Omnitrophota bacterium]